MRPTDDPPLDRWETIPRRDRVSKERGLSVAALALAAAGALLAAVLAIAFLGRGAGPRPADAPTAPLPLRDPTEDPPPSSPARRDSSRAPAVPLAPGHGRIRVFVTESPDRPRKEDCVVSVGPTSLLLVPGTPVERLHRLPAGSDSCVFEDLPDGAYLVRAAADGMNGEAAPLALGPEARDVAVRFTLRPAAFVDGIVIDEESAPLEGILLALEAEGPGGARRETRSDAAGRYRFETVLDGIYRIRVGPPETPLAEPVRIEIRGSPLRHDVHLPVLGSLEVAVTDAEGRPLGGARVDGYGPPGGTFHGETSPEGTFLAANLPPGSYRLQARAEGHEGAYLEATVAPKEKGAVKVTLSPRAPK